MDLFTRGGTFLIFTAVSLVTVMVFSKSLGMLIMPTIGLLAAAPSSAQTTLLGGVDFNYYPPSANRVNSLASALNSTGVYGFVFNTSQTTHSYATYNWCNMPHTRREEYIIPPAQYKLEYVEVIHRHHKRTPYVANTFPVENQAWDCSDTALYSYSQPNTPIHNASAPVYWRFYESPVNPFVPAGFPPHTCAFPQVTREGLDDSYQHGKDLYGVYHDLLHLIPSENPLSSAVFRVTNNPITSEVAGMLISGMFGSVASASVQLLVQAPDIDSLEPRYTCSAAAALYASYGPGSSYPPWTEHLDLTQSLFSRLDGISGVDPAASDWHVSYDHYFDNLSARLCHQKPLPCNATLNPTQCVENKDANEVFRLGEYEYAFIYRSAGNKTLQASRASFGIWVAELANNLQAASRGRRPLDIAYRHNFAHDGSLARLLSILQLDEMVWPGMGSEVVFELYSMDNSSDNDVSSGPSDHFVRILWSGQPLKSSSPTLQADQDLIPLGRLLAYFDGLVGRNASLVAQLCAT